MNLGWTGTSRALRHALLPVACVLLLAAVRTQDAVVRVWITAADQSHLLTRGADPAFHAGAGSGPFVIAVDDNTVYQQMTGFGASMTESSAWLLYRQLDAGTRDAAMRQLFSPVDGIGVSFLRQPIGASDFSLSHYSYDDVPFGERDDNLARFTTARDEAFVFPALREARRLNPALAIMASPWSPPGWMKTSGSMVGGALLPDAREPFASYLVRTVQALQAQGIPVDSVSLQNEPHYVPQDYPGMYMLAPEQALLIGQHVGPAFARAGINPKILVWDQNWNDTDYPSGVLRDAAAAQYADGAAFHCYAGDASAMTQLHDAFPAATIYVTECSTGAWTVTPFNTALYENMRLLVRSTRNWAQAVVKWNVALDENLGPRSGGCTTCSALVTVNRATGTVHPTADFYAVGHFSKFVAPGARRVASTNFEPQGVESVAFVNPDGSHALVVWNGWGPRRVAVSWQGSAFEYDLPGEAVATFVWGAGSTPPPNPPSPPVPPSPPPGFQLPGRIEAEDFLQYSDATAGNSGGEYRVSDVDIERSTDAGGGFNVGWISPGEWLSYPISVAAGGTYRLEARVAAYGPGGAFHLEVDGAPAGHAMNIPNTGGWQNWTTVATGVTLAPGAHTLRVLFDRTGATGIVGNLNVIDAIAVAEPSSWPFGGAPAALPGRVEAERFDNGPSGLAYHDEDAWNSGGQFRATAVDIEPTTDAGGGFNVGWMAPGEWLAYSAVLSADASLRFDVRVAALGPGGRFHLEIDGADISGPLSIVDTGGWQNWITVSTGPVALSAGPHVLRVVVDAAGPTGVVGNVNWIDAH